jgi:hypothetical protein
MKIDAYSFGSITVDGETYTSDVIIYPGRVDPSWWRKEGHRLAIADLTDIVRAKPEVLVIGRGYAGVMSVPDEVRNYLVSQGIEIHVKKTTEAVQLFNSLQKGRIVIGAFHITC